MNLDKYLCCPNCYENLSQKKVSLFCEKCKIDFPILENNKSLNLQGDPTKAVQNAQILLREWLADVDGEIDALTQKLSLPKLLKSTEARIKNLKEGLIKQKKNVLAHLSFLNFPLTSKLNPLDEARSRMRDANEKLNAYEANIPRDWAWGKSENQIHLEQIKNLIPSGLKSGSLLFLGSGAGRLCFDFARDFPDFEVYCIERNPLLFGVSLSLGNEKMETWDWIEFPKLPQTPKSAAFSLKLSRPEKTQPPKNLVKIWGNAFLPPFKQGSFDCVVTSWFTDVVPQGLDAVTSLVAYCLKPGGAWIQNGALAWTRRPAQNQITGEEFLEFLENNPIKFKIVNSQTSFVPYLNSPYSQMQRTEQVFGFCAQLEKAQNPDALVKQFKKSNKPQWLNEFDLPIPRIPELEKLQVETTILYFALSHLDGKRSLNEIAQAFATQFGLTPEESAQTISLFLEKNIGFQ